ncbi:MAG TPA: hypothetical protein VJ960_06000 [Oceanipulchritudo sp.]|nr:hypothetical protein [Oceanipulchritudo sp.]
MKTYHLITTAPVALAPNSRPTGLPLRMSRPDDMTVEQVNEGMPDGYKYVPDLPRPEIDSNTQRLDRAAPTLDGYGWLAVDLTDEEIEARKPPIRPVTKLTLMRRLSELGKWQTFKALLAQLPEEVRDAWDLAQDIRSDDPLFVSNADSLKASLELTDQQFEDLLSYSDV